MINFTDEAAPGTPYWWAEATPQNTSDVAPERADVAIIGAGYTGLSAALVAADAGARVVVLDAGVPGAGASSRNGGMFGAHPRLGWSALAKAFGAETADALFAEATPAINWVRDLITREEINCDFQQTGRIQLAWSKVQFENQKRLAQDVSTKSDVKITVRSREDLAQDITTERYFGGLVFEDHCAIHPAKFHAGLMAAAARRGIAVVGECPVTRVARDGAVFELDTPQRKIRADKVILATNGYTPRAFNWHSARVFPLPSYLIATEELPSNLLGHLVPGRRMMVETRARHSYYRLSPDGKRILFGGRASMRQLPPEQAAKRLFATMCEIWPDLKDTKVSHAWTGNTGYSFSHMPQVGTHNGMQYAMGFSGSGTVMAPYLGAKAAYLALGDARAATPYNATALRRHWMHFGHRPHFLTLADFWYRNWVDRIDARAGR
ncbi:MAG: NAD(P)/FAD-dependent oxidoreductase [Sedimentitalea sp.]